MKLAWRVDFKWSVFITKLEYERKTEKTIFIPKTEWCRATKCAIFSDGRQYYFSMKEAVELARQKITEKVEHHKKMVADLRIDLAKMNTAYENAVNRGSDAN